MSKALWRKLGYRRGMVACLDEAPEHYRALLRGLPQDVRLDGTLDDRPKLIHHFTTEAEGLRARLAVFKDVIPKTGAIWISWPKKASGVPTDMSGDAVRAAALPLGLVDVKVCRIDQTWTALKLVIRKEDR
ncbi:hypothetical protein B1759_07725 [Rubrivirga sp. SAORIC476]|uniref:DUF3052 family protein n=1 Tax=Rubrivirga sp. SAORIC476 TaxID=1961794 RepID=UPI000BA95B7D|nr:DUF3052 family protein [Rubrivirga sp. SAORIC476]PAP81216.1 hypothetical protein B1759_07725 [Rubrivirga sp. SAORIC476]